MSRRKIARRQIAAAHLQSTARGARLLAAADGDVEHAERIDHALAELHAVDSRPLAPVINLPTSFACTVDEAGDARPYDFTLELASERRRSLAEGWPTALALGLAVWALLLAIAGGVWAFT